MGRKIGLLALSVALLVFAACVVYRTLSARHRVPRWVNETPITKTCANCEYEVTKTIAEWMKIPHDPVYGHKCPKCGKLMMRHVAECPYCKAKIPDSPSWGAAPERVAIPGEEPFQPVGSRTYKCPKCGREIVSN